MRLPSLASLGGRFRVQHRHPDRGLVWDFDVANGVTVEGRNYLLSAGFKGGPQAAAWRLGVIDGAAFAGVDEDDTHALHPGWAEFAGVSGGTRPTWAAGTPGGGQLGSAASATVTLSASGAVRGIFLADAAAVGSLSAGNTLYSTAVVLADLAVTSGGVLFVTYSLRGVPQG